MVSFFKAVFAGYCYPQRNTIEPMALAMFPRQSRIQGLLQNGAELNFPASPRSRPDRHRFLYSIKNHANLLLSYCIHCPKAL